MPAGLGSKMSRPATIRNPKIHSRSKEAPLSKQEHNALSLNLFNINLYDHLSPTIILIILDILIGLPVTYKIVKLIYYACGCNNRLLGISAIVLLNLFFVIWCGGEIVVAAREREIKLRRLRREAEWWDGEVRKLEDLKLQMLVKKEASEGFMVDEVEASELRINV